MIVLVPERNILHLHPGNYESQELLDWLYQRLDIAQSDDNDSLVMEISRQIRYTRNLIFLASPVEKQVELAHTKKRRAKRPEDPDDFAIPHLDAAGWETREVDDEREWINYFSQQRRNSTKVEELATQKQDQAIQFDNVVVYGLVYDIQYIDGYTRGRYWNERTRTTWAVVATAEENRWAAVIKVKP